MGYFCLILHQLPAKTHVTSCIILRAKDIGAVKALTAEYPNLMMPKASIEIL